MRLIRRTQRMVLLDQSVPSSTAPIQLHAYNNYLTLPFLTIKHSINTFQLTNLFSRYNQLECSAGKLVNLLKNTNTSIVFERGNGKWKK